MKRVILSVIASMGVVGISGGKADAMSYAPCRGFQGEVPERPVFVIKHRRNTELSHGAVVAGKNGPLPYRMQRIDPDYVKLIVEAEAGDVFELADQSRCSPGTLKATRPWDATGKRRLDPSFRLEWQQDSTRLEVTWPTPGLPSETRIDWAYSADELSRGLYQTDITENWLHDRERSGLGGGASHVIYPDLDSEMVVLRLTRYWPDGTTEVWNGWVHLNAGGELLVEEGLPTRPDVASFRAAHPCEPGDVRTVPVHPNFYVYPGLDAVGWRATGLAETRAGVALPVHVRDDSTITITAGEGQEFRFDRLPRPACPVFLRATSDRSNDPAPRVVGFDVSGYADSPRGWVLDLELESWRWPMIEVRWSRSREDLQNSAAVERHAPEHLSFTNMHWESPVNVPADIELFYIQLTPSWQGGVRGRSWTGVARIDPESGRASVKAIGDDSRTGLTVQSAPTPEVEPVKSEGGSWVWPVWSGLGILAWLVATLILRRNPLRSTMCLALDGCSAPQLAVVAGGLASVWSPVLLPVCGVGLAVHVAILRQRQGALGN